MKGHVRRRGARSWELKYDADRAGGRRRTVFKSFKGTRREAQAELVRLLAQVADGGHVDPSRLTVAEYMRSRLQHWRAMSAISPKTAQGYAGLIENQIVPFLGTKLIQKLATRDIETWHATLLTKGAKGRHGRPDGQGGVSARTVGHAHRVLAKALHEATRHELVLRNVCTAQRAPKIAAEDMHILSPQQVIEFSTLLEGHELGPPALVALFTGLRRGEILALRWGSVDLDAKLIRIRASLEATKAGLRFKAPKSKAGTRDITLPAIVADALRHTHASQLIDAGVDVVTISRRLGHSSPTITLSTYAHLFKKDDSKAAAAINAALGVPV